jgi:hypothetical protein
MAGTIPLAEFVTLGQELYALMNPQNVDVVIGEIEKFRASLRKCGLPRTSTAAETLAQVQSIRYSLRSGLISDADRALLQGILGPIWRTLYAEIGEQFVVSVNIGVVSQQLRQLPTSLTLTQTQTDLVNETVTCIECGAYRAGAVIGWNLAYDVIRQWVFDKHLEPFNAAFTTFYVSKDGKPQYEPIVDYSDFFSGKPGERTMIDTCFHASLFGERIRDNLRFYLRRRNDYAHPTFMSPSADQTNAYIKDLADTITAAPFKT